MIVSCLSNHFQGGVKMKEHLTIANSPLMFVLCSIVILFVVV